MASNLVMLEWRQFRGKPPLNLATTVEKFEQVLGEIFTYIGEGQLTLEAIDVRTSKEEFVRLFYENRVMYLDVAHFGIFPVPEDIELVNPNPQLEGALRDLLQHDREVRSIGRLTAEVEPAPASDLKRAAIARGALHSSEPRVLKYQRPGGQVLIRRQNEQGMFEVSIGTDGIDTVDDRIRLVHELLELVRSTDIGDRAAQLEQRQRNLFEDLDDE